MSYETPILIIRRSLESAHLGGKHFFPIFCAAHGALLEFFEHCE